MACKAFVSSTFEDLREHRREVIASLRKAGILVDPMEEWTASSSEPKEFSQDRIKDCDLCVLLVGFRRGHVPADEGLSITQLECQAATDSKIDVLAFLLKEDAPWPRKFDELDKDPGIRQWRAELMERRGIGFFGLEPSSIEIAPTLTRWMAEKQESSMSADARRARIVLLSWLWRMSDECDGHSRELWRLGSGGSGVSSDQQDHLATVTRELLGRCTPIVEKLPAALAETKPSDREQRCFAEAFPEFSREANACFEAFRKLVSDIGTPTTDGSRVAIPFSITYQELELPEHLRALRMAAEKLVNQFPVDEVEDARQAGFSAVIRAAQALKDAAAGSVQQLGNESRAKLAGFFDRISNVLQQFVDMTRGGKHSAGPCAELAQYAKGIRDVASPTLPTEKVEALAKQLAHLCENWQKIAPSGEPGAQAHEIYLTELEAGAGAFRGLANVMHAQ
jgi:hypothetical protein